MNTLTLRPTADVAKATLYYSTGTDAYALVDEAVASDTDYIYAITTYGLGDVTFGWGDTGRTTGTIAKVSVYARAKGASTSAALKLFNTAMSWSGTTRNLTTSFALYLLDDLTTNPDTGEAWAWDEIDALQTLKLRLYTSGGDTVVSQVYIVVSYTSPPYFDSIEVLGMSNGYANVRGILKAGVPALTYKEAQIDHEDTFADPLADTTELEADSETEGETVSLIVSWTPSAAGTYYARLGVRSSGEDAPTWLSASFTVQFPTIDSITVSQSQEHATVTVTVSDDYADPPKVTVFVDGQAYVAHR